MLYKSFTPSAQKSCCDKVIAPNPSEGKYGIPIIVDGCLTGWNYVSFPECPSCECVELPVCFPEDVVTPVRFDSKGCVVEWACESVNPAPIPYYDVDTQYLLPKFDGMGRIFGWVTKNFPQCPECPLPANATNCVPYFPECIEANTKNCEPYYPECPECPNVCLSSGEIGIGDKIIRDPWQASGLFGYTVTYSIKNVSNRNLSGLIRTSSFDYETNKLLKMDSKSFSLSVEQSQFINVIVARIAEKKVKIKYIIEFILNDGSVVGSKEDNI